MIMYGLRVRDESEMLRVQTYCLGPSDLGNVIACELSHFGDGLWLSADRAHAERVAGAHTVAGYSSYDSPENRFVGRLEVVEVRMTVSPVL